MRWTLPPAASLRRYDRGSSIPVIRGFARALTHPVKRKRDAARR